MKAIVLKVINPTTCKVFWKVSVKNLRYGKYQKITQNRIVHYDSKKTFLSEGDVVSIFPCKPMSKTKKWKVK